MRSPLYWLKRFAWLWVTPDASCSVRHCPRPQVPAASIWCRRHTDSIFSDRFAEAAKRLRGLDASALLAEVDAELERRAR